MMMMMMMIVLVVLVLHGSVLFSRKEPPDYAKYKNDHSVGFFFFNVFISSPSPLTSRSDAHFCFCLFGSVFSAAINFVS